MKRTEARSIKQIIDAALSESDMRGALMEQRVCYLWPEVVGPGINRYTTRRFVEGGRMHVFISSGPLKGELAFHRSALVAQLNRAAGADVITEIVIH